MHCMLFEKLRMADNTTSGGQGSMDQNRLDRALTEKKSEIHAWTRAKKFSKSWTGPGHRKFWKSWTGPGPTKFSKSRTDSDRSVPGPGGSLQQASQFGVTAEEKTEFRI